MLPKKKALRLQRNTRVEVVGQRSILRNIKAIQLLRNPRVEVAGQRSILRNIKAIKLLRHPRVEVAGPQNILKNSFLPRPISFQGHHIPEALKFIPLVVEVILQVTLQVINLLRYGLVMREPLCPKVQLGQIIIGFQHQGLETLVLEGMVEITAGGSDGACWIISYTIPFVNL